MAMIFVVEPLLSGRLERRAARDPESLLKILHRAHGYLLACAALTGAGAVMGVHGFDLF